MATFGLNDGENVVMTIQDILTYAALFSIVIFIAAVQLILVLRARHGRTPHDLRRRGRYDVFVSYKSEDAWLARPCAELLLAAGWRVWFDEYVILLTEGKQFRREMILGVWRSRYGVCITTKSYFSSRWCREELRGLMKKHRRNPQRIVNARLSEYPTPTTIDLPMGPTNTCTSLHSLMRFVEQATGLASVPAPDESRPLRKSDFLTHSDLPRGWRLDTSGWIKGEPVEPRVIHRDGSGVDYVRPYRRGMVVCHAQLRRTGKRNHLASTVKLSALQTLKVEAQAEFGDIYLLECLGVHVIKALKKTHPGFTLFVGRLPTAWCRVYRVFLDDCGRRHTWMAEFEFSLQGTFREFCAVTHFMDHMVSSISPVDSAT
ncbi:MAG: toll/interleukin-1 receptor domain-containing protein [Deltaproteobacteria bacterium]|nr:toll/interleukin-1 receptor domain-containing protein [Deltaproteobacteria bacterium]